jgi:tetratricopeptide (TPR) repeat protein
VLLKKGNVGAARRYLQRSVGISPLNAEAWTLLAEAEERLGRPAASLEAANKATGLDPTIGRARFAAGLAQLQLGEPAGVDVLLVVLESNPGLCTNFKLWLDTRVLPDPAQGAAVLAQSGCP